MSTDLSSWPQSPPPLSSVPDSPPVSVPPVTPGVEAPRPGPAPPPAPVAPDVDAARPVPPPAARTAYAVLAHLSNGDRIEVAVHDDEPSARAEATALMRYLRDGRGDWPYLAGRFVRPDAIVSVDIDETA